MTNIPYGEAGIAGFETSDSFTSVELFNSAIPHPVTEDFPVGENTTLPVNSVVGLSAGNLVLAKTSATAVVPIGVTTVAVTTGAGVTDRIAIYRAGNFNPAALNWHADYDTTAKKVAAFRGSPTPTNIVIRERL
ncbi:head decoration protein [Rhizobium leguminosarum]|uniref:head decoration protein n=1 Tax=Rhizobium phage vB_RleM_PPF1 TaxID=1498228 RepID=UPI000499F8D6|nr:head decoration protein [Rhizobium leguminosarum]YP_009099570.1 head decoration protein [Rhizobium phage vB_RleM_PPF1]AID18320.1 putative head decorative protein [Rhizobium phage vB_RleM_PPF1]MBY2911362.1 head decoration protein [Rhizobium leguminosarum]